MIGDDYQHSPLGHNPPCLSQQAAVVLDVLENQHGKGSMDGTGAHPVELREQALHHRSVGASVAQQHRVLVTSDYPRPGCRHRPHALALAAPEVEIEMLRAGTEHVDK